jgi:N-acetylmuramoyl-L-alanine amidase
MKLPRACSLMLGAVMLASGFEFPLDSGGLAWAQARRTQQQRRVPTATPRRSGGESISPQSASGDDARSGLPSKTPSSGARVQVIGVKLLTLKEQTRVMVDLSGETKYEIRQLKEDPERRTPPRIYIDIIGAKLAMESKDTLQVENGMLRQLRMGQFSEDVVRVVLDMDGMRAHHAFMISQPSQLVVDILANGTQPKFTVTESVAVKPESAAQRAVAKVKKPEPPAISGGLRKIVLDPGHGGKDPGAIGVGGIAEKDIVLSVAKKLARKLRAELGVEVVLTRNDDRFVPLEDRTAIANSEEADLFISLHVNASPNSDSRGIETYYLDNTTDEAAIRLAARENGTSRRNISDLQFILSDMTQNMKLEDSITLAHRLQGSLVGGMDKLMGDVKDLGVKKALFYVLVGARMPSVLVEMFFITNRAEARALTQESHQDALVNSLYEGIQKFGQTNLAAKTL